MDKQNQIARICKALGIDQTDFNETNYYTVTGKQLIKLMADDKTMDSFEDDSLPLIKKHRLLALTWKRG